MSLVSHTSTSLLVLASLCGGAVVGMLLRRALPQHHLEDSSKNAVFLGTGLLVTMSALVLGLLVSSAYTSFDRNRAELTDMCAKIALLDRVLAYEGPEAKEARDLLRALTGPRGEDPLSSRDRATRGGWGEPIHEHLEACPQRRRPACDPERGASARERPQTRFAVSCTSSEAPPCPDRS